ncbi:MAG: hypothetical protein LUE90_08255, partial [Clostridiales bacterium]|nr:hypothetical protein [Clostridiales bacterium]
MKSEHLFALKALYKTSVRMSIGKSNIFSEYMFVFSNKIPSLTVSTVKESLQALKYGHWSDPFRCHE